MRSSRAVARRTRRVRGERVPRAGEREQSSRGRRGGARRASGRSRRGRRCRRRRRSGAGADSVEHRGPRVAPGETRMALSSAVIGSRTPPTVRRGPALDNGWEDACSEARAAHRILGPRAHRRSSSSSSCWRPSGSATTRSGPPRPTAPTRRRSSPGSRRRRRTIKLGSAIFQMPGRSAAMTAMTAATHRPALRRADAARDRLQRARRWPRAGTGSASPSSSQRTREYVAVVRHGAGARAGGLRRRDAELPLPDGPGKALKLTISPVQERIPIYIAAIGPEEHDAGGRDRRRLAADAVLPRARRRVPAAAGGGLRRAPATARASTTSTSSRP